MKGCNIAYCNAAIDAVIAAAGNLMQTTIREAVSATPYGKGDTLGLDAIPEIEIANHLTRFDPDAILVTEELGHEARRTWPTGHSHHNQPMIFFCDPTDRSAELRKFLQFYAEHHGASKVGEILQQSAAKRMWAKIASSPLSITGATSAITCVRQGAVAFTVLLNYITQEIIVACSAGIYRYPLGDTLNLRPGRINLSTIISRGIPVLFSAFDASDNPWDRWKTFTTFLGKTGYAENFRDSMIFIEESEKRPHYDRPGGPARILYLSNLQPKHRPLGFILANGEKIGEWIHWLSCARFAQVKGERSLLLFEISHERPWTKNGVLMSTTPAYSIFRTENDGTSSIDVSQLARFDNPSLFRSTLLVAPVSNEWALNTMHQHQYRRIILPPAQPAD